MADLTEAFSLTILGVDLIVDAQITEDLDLASHRPELWIDIEGIMVADDTHPGKPYPVDIYPLLTEAPKVMALIDRSIRRVIAARRKERLP